MCHCQGKTRSVKSISTSPNETFQGFSRRGQPTALGNGPLGDVRRPFLVQTSPLAAGETPRSIHVANRSNPSPRCQERAESASFDLLEEGGSRVLSIIIINKHSRARMFQVAFHPPRSERGYLHDAMHLFPSIRVCLSAKRNGRILPKYGACLVPACLLDSSKFHPHPTVYNLREILYTSSTTATPVTAAAYAAMIPIAARGPTSSVGTVMLTSPVRRFATKKTARPLRL